jgi:bifunctional non-homologous end joining protein LigD
MRRVTCITTSEYGDFEGVIPPKQYGASTVLLWDQGTWHAIEDAKAVCIEDGCASQLGPLIGGWELQLERSCF